MSDAEAADHKRFEIISRIDFDILRVLSKLLQNAK